MLFYKTDGLKQMPTDYQALAARTAARRIVLYERQVTAALQKALVEIRKDIGVLYERYTAADGILTTADRATAARLASVEKQVVSELNTALNTNLATMRTIHPQMYEDTFLQSAWAIDQTGGIRLNYTRLNMRAIRANLASREYADALRRYSPVQRARIREALNTGLIRGKGYKDMMEDLKTAISVTRGDAFRIVRTEGQRAANAGRAAAFAEAEGQGVEGKTIWVATIDGETRDQHYRMDGEARDEDGIFHMPNGDTGQYPLDSSLSAENVVNCRCGTRFEITGYEPQLRRTRDAGLIPYQPFTQWQPARA